MGKQISLFFNNFQWRVQKWKTFVIIWRFPQLQLDWNHGGSITPLPPPPQPIQFLKIWGGSQNAELIWPVLVLFWENITTWCMIRIFECVWMASHHFPIIVLFGLVKAFKICPQMAAPLQSAAEVEFLNSEELSLIKSSPLPAQLPRPGRS